MSIMRDFIEEFGGVIAASFLMMMAVSLLTGVFTAVLMLLGISVVVFLVYFFWMHGRAVQVLMEIWFGKMNQKFRNLFEGYPRKYTRILQIFSQRISWHVECGRGEKTE